MTALVPTVGHQYLVDFAANYMKTIGGKLTVLVCGRSIEPIPVTMRLSALKNPEHTNVDYIYMENDPPQNPEDAENFWDIWVSYAINAVHFSGEGSIEYLFASEMYGLTYARKLGAQFIPCDIDREIFNVKGTNVRTDYVSAWDSVIPSFRPFLRKTFTFFGAESTGKTTQSKIAAKTFGGTWVHEWARPYLEKLGPEVTDEKMEVITNAQYSVQKSVHQNPATRAIVFQDTDLLSTVGYYRIYSKNSPAKCDELAYKTRSDFYFVMNSTIPFKEDVLRYGGSVRESKDQFWIDILEEFGCKFHVVESISLEDRTEEIHSIIKSMYAHDPIKTFIRD